MSSPFLIGIAGGSASGKSTFVQQLTALLKNSAPELSVHSISTDHYFYRDFADIPTYTSPTFQTELPDFNHPDALNIPQLLADLQEQSQELEPARVILVEGHLLFYYEALRNQFDLRIFIDLDGETRALRRMVRNLERPGDPIPDHSAQSIANYYLESARQGYRKFIEPTRQYADLIINGDGDFQRTAALIAPIIISQAN